MDYQLYSKADASQALAHARFDDDFAAEKWARSWVQEAGRGDDFLIKREDGGLTAQLFRTNAGQWYIMRQ